MQVARGIGGHAQAHARPVCLAVLSSTCPPTQCVEARWPGRDGVDAACTVQDATVASRDQQREISQITHDTSGHPLLAASSSSLPPLGRLSFVCLRRPTAIPPLAPHSLPAAEADTDARDAPCEQHAIVPTRALVLSRCLDAWRYGVACARTTSSDAAGKGRTRTQSKGCPPALLMPPPPWLTRDSLPTRISNC